MTDGADVNLNNAIRLIMPLAVTIAVFALINEIIMRLFSGERLHDIFLRTANYLFSLTGKGFFSGLLFVVLSGILWFFGIHGSDILEGVSSSLFAPGVEINAALLSSGRAPTEILTKQFFDIFVLMGGCGSTLCLLIALLLFSKRRSNRGLAKMAAFPMIFNINEIMVFGLPIIYNPFMFIPFLCVPTVCYLTSYAAMYFGLVPMVTSGVEWTIPAIFGGYMATGSWAGSALQIFNLIIGVLIYKPFVKKYDDERQKLAVGDYKHLTETMKKSETSREQIVLTELSGTNGAFAKALAADIVYAIEEKNLELYYQPQFKLSGECFGAEALLRMKLPSIGVVYPPLVIQIAKESGKLKDLEEYIFKKTLEDAKTLHECSENPLEISVNISGVSIQSKEFEEFLIEEASKYDFNNPICIEITEQTAIDFNNELKERIDRLRAAGFLFAIDAFSAGNTSLSYLQETCFDMVKLDGSIVGNCIDNPRSNEIITSIIELSHNLGFKVLAEFVSSEEIRDCMAAAGCTMYQGWFYSKAIEFEEFKKLIINN